MKMLEMKLTAYFICSALHVPVGMYLRIDPSFKQLFATPGLAGFAEKLGERNQKELYLAVWASKATYGALVFSYWDKCPVKLLNHIQYFEFCLKKPQIFGFLVVPS